MTAPLPPTRPPRLSFVTFPLLFSLLVNATELLLLPFQGAGTILASYRLAEEAFGVKLPTPTDAEIQVTLWLTFAIMVALITFLSLTRRAVLEGRRWSWVASVVIAVVSLLAVPVGPVVGAAMLFGLFDRDVRAFLTR